MHTLLCARPPRVVSLFPLVLLNSCHEILLAFKVWFSGNSYSRCWNPSLGSLTWGSEPSLQGVDFCGIIVVQFVSHPPSGYGIWFYCDCAPHTVSFQLLLCLWMWGIFFGEFQCLPVNDCPAVSFDSGVLTRGSESTSYSAILNQSKMAFLSAVFSRDGYLLFSAWKASLWPFPPINSIFKSIFFSCLQLRTSESVPRRAAKLCSGSQFISL